MSELLGRIGDYQQGRELTRLAEVLTLHLFIRSSELRFARWSEIDFRHKIWTIPATREAIDKVRFSGRGAKMRTPHIVPLSRQAIALLKQIQELSGHLDLVFPGDHNPYKPMSENTTNRALRLMGYDTLTYYFEPFMNSVIPSSSGSHTPVSPNARARRHDPDPSPSAPGIPFR